MRSTLRSALVAAALLTGSAAAFAQGPAPLTLNRSDLDVGDKGFKDADTYFIPAVNLYIAHHGTMFVVNGKASVKAAYHVDGLDNAHVQELSRKIEEDLATKLRAAGIKVVTYADLKDNPEVAKRDRLENDKQLGIPTKKSADGRTVYLVATGTPEQAFKSGVTGPVFPFRNIAKSEQMLVLLPEIWIETPTLSSEKSRGYKSSSASIDVDPSMKMHGLFVWGLTPKGGGAHVKLKGAVYDVTEAAGTVVKESSNRTDLGLGTKRSKGDFSMTLNREAFEAGVLRAGYAVNDAIVATAMGVRK